MSLTQLPLTHLPEAHLPAGPAAHGAAPAELRSDDRPVHQDHAATSLSDELVDLYALVLIAVPLAMFLKWLWP